MEEKKEYCVYRHKSFDDRIYIGVTCQDVNRRWRNGQGYSHNDYFNRFIKKWGWDSMEHKVLYSNLSKEEAERLEKKLILFYNSTNYHKGFNITKGGSLYGTHTEESKRKMSVTKRSRPDVNAIPVRCIETNILYKSIREAERQTGVCAPNISANCKGKVNHAGVDDFGKPFHWIYESEREKIPLSVNNIRLEKERECCFEEEMFDEYKQRCVEQSQSKPKYWERKTVYQYDLNGNLIGSYFGVVEASKITGCNKGAIARRCCGHGLTCGGYLWSYEERTFSKDELIEAQNASCHQTILQYNGNMELIAEYPEGKGLIDNQNYRFQTIRNVCNRFKDCAYGYVWRYKGESEEQYQSDKEFYSKRKIFTREQSIVQYTADGMTVKVYKSLATVKDEGYDRNRVSRCCRGLQKSYKGYIWKYAD